MACDTNNQSPSDTDHQKYAAYVGAAKLDHLDVFMCVLWQRTASYGSEQAPWVEMFKQTIRSINVLDFELFFS